MTASAPPRVGPLLARLFQHVSVRRRWQAGFVLLLTLASSVAEVVSLGAVIPFIGVLTTPERVLAHHVIGPMARSVGITTAAELVLPLTIAFAVAAIVAGALRLLLVAASLRLGSAAATDLSVDVFRRTLHQPYRVHVARNSSEIIAGITQKVAAVAIMLTAIAGVMTSSVLFLAILAALLAFDPRVALTAMFAFGAGYGLIAWQSRRRLARNSDVIAREQTATVRSLQEGLGGIRDVLLDGTQEVHSAEYGRAIAQLQRATNENIFLSQAPRYGMETLGMVLVAGLAYALTAHTTDVGSALPILGALGLGAQRLLPLLQQLYGNWAYISGLRTSLRDVLELLDQPLPADALTPPSAPMQLRQDIAFENVSFRYVPGGPAVLDDVSLRIERGTRVGVVGTTGSGKSTLLDLLMALLEPTSGRLLVDGEPLTPVMRRAWQRTIAHVPQTIHLADATIAENIAFGVPRAQIDMARVRQAAARAQLAPFIEARPGGYDAVVGERGVSLSGGQRQRIGIARALYKQASVLIFDEATNALDTSTERSVMRAIEALDENLTVVLVAHRLSTLAHCDSVVRLEHGRVSAQGSYQQIVAAGAAEDPFAADEVGSGHP